MLKCATGRNPKTGVEGGQESLDGYVLNNNEGDAFWFLGTLMTVKAGANETDRGFTLIECVAPPGFAPPPHVHRNEDEAFYLLDGQMSITCGDSTWTVEPGAFAFLPRGVPHVFSVTGPSPAKMLQFTLPAQFERFAAEMGEPARERTLPPPAEPDVPRLLEVMGKYGIDLAPPAG